jgi:hypothetical protein
MDHQTFLKFHKEFLDKMHATCTAKNKDYAGNNPNDYAFANFKMSEHLGVCSIEQGLVVRMSDKLSRLATFVKKGELAVKDESVLDTCQDLANYSVILAAVVKSKSEHKKRVGDLEINRSSDTPMMEIKNCYNRRVDSDNTTRL